jgi:kanosamine 6-kinase
MAERLGYLGIDVGGTKVALRAEDDAGRVAEAAVRWPAPADPAADLAVLARAVAELTGRWGGPPAAVGVALPATLDAAGTVTAWPGRPAWAGLPVAGELARLFPAVPVRVADDGDVAALAEAAHAGCRDLVYLGVGTGVGGGVVVDGRPVPGPGRGSCEVGHLIVDRAADDRCDCGRRGCVQAVASGPATLRRAAALRGGAGPVEFAELRHALAAGAPWAWSAVADSCAALAAAVAGLCELVAPERVLIGGGFAAGLPGFVDRVAARVRDLARPGRPPVPVGAAALGGLSSLHGAVRLARGGL